MVEEERLPWVTSECERLIVTLRSAMVFSLVVQYMDITDCGTGAGWEG